MLGYQNNQQLCDHITCKYNIYSEKKLAQNLSTVSFVVKKTSANVTKYVS
jgi:hypothetical protein